MSRAVPHSRMKIAALISRPTIGSASGKPGQHPDHAEYHGQRGEPVGAGVHAVGDQRRGADPAADPDPVDGDQLVAGEPDQRRRQHPAQICQRLRLEEPADRLIAGQHRRQAQSSSR